MQYLFHQLLPLFNFLIVLFLSFFCLFASRWISIYNCVGSFVLNLFFFCLLVFRHRHYFWFLFNILTIFLISFIFILIKTLIINRLPFLLKFLGCKLPCIILCLIPICNGHKFALYLCKIYDIFVCDIYFSIRDYLIFRLINKYTIFAFRINNFNCSTLTYDFSMNLWNWSVFDCYAGFCWISTHEIYTLIIG